LHIGQVKMIKNKSIIQVMKISLLILVLILFAIICQADDPDSSEDENIDFTTFSLEELKEIEIVSASKKPEKISEIPSAVFVITQDDIRRSGASSIPEALRLAPGLQVARIELTEWAITIRGLNQEFSNNLLVLIDGRSVYSSVFSGVFWEVQDTFMEDIDRIEIIRGPGATIWGVNAVNGVINIITKNAEDTQGKQVTAVSGTDEESGGIRYGSVIGDDLFYRTYIKYFNRNDYDNNKTDIDDNWKSVRGGFRADKKISSENSLTLQSEAYLNRYETDFTQLSLYAPYLKEKDVTTNDYGYHILGRWQHIFSERSDIILQFYYDRAKTDYSPGKICVDTFDLDFRHNFNPFPSHEIVWGAGYRFITDNYSIEDVHDKFQIDVTPYRLDQHIFNLFIQDKIHLIPDYLNLTIGSKIEHNDYTGFELQPSIRLLWTPVKDHAFWGGVSRAVRTPSRIERNMKMVTGMIAPQHWFIKDVVEPEISYEHRNSDAPGVFRLIGNENLDSEELIAYEIGYRTKLSDKLYIDTAAFYYDYDNLISNSSGYPYLEKTPLDYYVIPFYYSNSMNGEAHGIEVSADLEVNKQWRLKPSYCYLKTRLLPDDDITNALETEYETKSNPSHQFSIRSSMYLFRDIEFDLWLRYVDSLTENEVESYTTLDARLSWKPMDNLELSIVGQNLLEKQHKEFSSYEVEQSLYLKAAWGF